jgi:purine nucleosidase
LQPLIVSHVAQLVTMGGSFNLENRTPEFNTHCDPEAAQIVLNAGWPVRMVGLQITNQITFTRADFAACRNGIR